MFPALEEFPFGWYRGVKTMMPDELKTPKEKQFCGHVKEEIQSNPGQNPQCGESFREVLRDILSISYITEKKGSNWSELPHVSAPPPPTLPDYLYLDPLPCLHSSVDEVHPLLSKANPPCMLGTHH